MIDKPKLCVDCKWHRKSVIARVSVCCHPMLINPATGRPVRTCEEERKSSSVCTMCGTQAELFEPKEIK